MEGWFKCERKWLENGVITKDSDYLSLYIHLWAEAAFEKRQTVIGDEPVILYPGQLITGRRVLAEKVGITESKVTRILNLFEKAGLIEQRTTPFGRLITLLDADIERLANENIAKSE